MRSAFVLPVAVGLVVSAACGKSKSTGCNVADPSSCGGGEVCEQVSGAQPACFAPLVVKGRVTDLASGTGLAAARVVALDSNRAPASSVATTDANGNYTLSVPATRASGGAPIAEEITLRADAQDYQPFPGGIRTALPIDLSTATQPGDGTWRVQGALTSIGLIHLQSTTGLMSISGSAAVPTTRVGVLVVAEPQAGGAGHTAIADTDGSFTIFNVPGSGAPGSPYTVIAYAQGQNYAPAAVTLTLGSAPAPVSLTISNSTAAMVAGNLIFNSGATTPTSVTLVVASTYDATLDRGESPPGLVAQVSSGASTYSLAGVPDGTYVILAAFGIDGDVRDVSGTGNTAPLEAVVQNGALVGSLGSFKLVGAVELTSIDGVAVGSSGTAIQLSSATPTFEWAKAPSYSSAATFETDVFDAFGNTVWTHSQSGNGGGPFTSTYAGVPLASGMYYQLRIKALDGAGNALSQTEDLKGVFFKP